ncbi:arsenate reductase family protein [Arenibacterium halophilum]|uniref:Arsenate reductase n=1 Tax=Arenibacterium halophilum TaxID=2583821 RepID=A0ABY2XCU0_9RHOB|nr:ArsC/Spx/MgsR family protein [Arenibacterium halophilum]TMV14841.1 arsenate reductase [Arenibacterium halophilum]
MLVYGLKSCDTCRKALKSLPEASFVDVRDKGVPAEVVGRAIADFGHELVNKRSTTWRNLSEEDRAADVATLIASHPTVMKRPLIVNGDQMHLGWSDEVRAALGVG